jgi:PAS domain S-box-containing protein
MTSAINQPERTDPFAFIVYALLALVWLKVIAEIVAEFFFDATLVWTPSLTWNLIFASVFTGGLLYFHKRIKADMAAKIKDHVKLFKKNPYPMWVYDLNTLRFLTVNEAAITLYGFSEAEFLSMKITDIRPQEDVPALITATDKAKLNFNHQYHWSGTWRHRKKNAELIYVEISSHEILFNGQKAELVLAYNVTDKVLQDQKLLTLNQNLEQKVITRTNDLLHLNGRLVDQNKVIKSANLELFTISNQLQEANQKIQEHADLKSRFISMASHEFRTPLANITFSSAFIRRNLEKLAPEKITQKLQGIEAQVTHMVALLDDVLTIGKADAVQLEVKNNPVDLYFFTTCIIDEVHTATGNSHTINLRMDEGSPIVVFTDAKFLRNILINLLNNAIKYSPTGCPVVIDISASDDTVTFEVIDQGMGIHQNDIDKIFEPFYRTQGTSNIQGTGLGLSIVKRAVDLLNAKIFVQSEINKGSTFVISLPRSAPGLSSEEQAETTAGRVKSTLVTHKLENH